MKFFSITSTNFKPLLLLLFSVSFATSGQAQNAYNSPYSRFGIGDLQTIQAPRNIAMGGLSVGLVAVQNLSVKNPASYINLDSMSVTFDLSLQTTYSKLSERQSNSEILSANTNSASLGQIMFAFPITSWLKSCFGLTPSSNMSYDVRREFTDNPNLGKYELYHMGQGGLNQVFFGLALGTGRVAVGTNVNYQFGTFTRNAILVFNDTILSLYPTQTRQDKMVEANGVSFDLGFQYKQPLSKHYRLGFGFSYTPRYSLNASRYTQISSEISASLKDTIYTSPTEEGTLKIPDMYTVGLSIERINRWVVGVEYSSVNFKNYREFSQSDPNLSKAYTFRAGAELKGQPLETDFFGRLSYRIGYHYGTNYVIFQDTELKQHGVSFGLGIPIRRSHSRLDFSVEIGRKGKVDNGQIQENYGRIVIGISAFDRWFMRGKFD